jgi:hypothetical protein
MIEAEIKPSQIDDSAEKLSRTIREVVETLSEITQIQAAGCPICEMHMDMATHAISRFRTELLAWVAETTGKPN